MVPGPVKSKIVLGSEFLQEPRRIQGLPRTELPTTLTHFARVIPRGELPFNVDFGVAQVANNIMPGVKLHARSQFALGISYRFLLSRLKTEQVEIRCARCVERFPNSIALLEESLCREIASWSVAIPVRL